MCFPIGLERHAVDLGPIPVAEKRGVVVRRFAPVKLRGDSPPSGTASERSGSAHRHRQPTMPTSPLLIDLDRQQLQVIRRDEPSGIERQRQPATSPRQSAWQEPPRRSADHAAATIADMNDRVLKPRDRRPCCHSQHADRRQQRRPQQAETTRQRGARARRQAGRRGDACREISAVMRTWQESARESCGCSTIVGRRARLPATTVGRSRCDRRVACELQPTAEYAPAKLTSPRDSRRDTDADHRPTRRPAGPSSPAAPAASAGPSRWNWPPRAPTSSSTAATRSEPTKCARPSAR